MENKKKKKIEKIGIFGSRIINSKLVCFCSKNIPTLVIIYLNEKDNEMLNCFYLFSL